jgi:hypothetical protein
MLPDRNTAAAMNLGADYISSSTRRNYPAAYTTDFSAPPITHFLHMGDLEHNTLAFGLWEICVDRLE